MQASESSDCESSEPAVRGNAEEDVRAQDRPIIGSDIESVDTAPRAVDAVDPSQNGQHRRFRLRESAIASEQPTVHRDARAVPGFLQRNGTSCRVSLARSTIAARHPATEVVACERAIVVGSRERAADRSGSCLVGRASVMDEAIDFPDGTISPVDGWNSLRTVMRSWGVFHRADPDAMQWLRGHGFAAAQPGNHISPRAQEFLFGEACRNDARVAFEAFLVRLTLHMGRTMAVPEGATPADRPTVPSHARSNGSPSWEQVGSVDLSECLLRRVPMLKSCSCFLRGRLRRCWEFALREGCRVKVAGDVDAEVRAWKLFCFVPMMILCTPKSVGSVGRDELAKRIDDFECGRWVELFEAVSPFTPCVRHRTQCTEEEDMIRRGPAAQSWVERGQVSRARHELTGTPLVPQDRGNRRTVATPASTGTAQRVATHIHGVPARMSVEFGQEDIPRWSSWFRLVRLPASMTKRRCGRRCERHCHRNSFPSIRGKISRTSVQ